MSLIPCLIFTSELLRFLMSFILLLLYDWFTGFLASLHLLRRVTSLSWIFILDICFDFNEKSPSQAHVLNTSSPAGVQTSKVGVGWRTKAHRKKCFWKLCLILQPPFSCDLTVSVLMAICLWGLFKNQDILTCGEQWLPHCSRNLRVTGAPYQLPGGESN